MMKNKIVLKYHASTKYVFRNSDTFRACYTMILDEVLFDLQKAEALVERVHAVLHAQRLRVDGSRGPNEGPGPQQRPADCVDHRGDAEDAGAHPKVHPEAERQVPAPP